MESSLFIPPIKPLLNFVFFQITIYLGKIKLSPWSRKVGLPLRKWFSLGSFCRIDSHMIFFKEKGYYLLGAISYTLGDHWLKSVSHLFITCSFASSPWYIWLRRNDKLFSGTSSNVKEVVNKIIYLAWTWLLNRSSLSSPSFSIWLQKPIPWLSQWKCKWYLQIQRC